MNKISVIITAYNIERYIGEAIQSALDQSELASEIVVIDDGSTDGTRAAVEKFGPAVSCYSQKNGGIGAARNAGVQKCSGTWLAFLDGDDIWKKDKLKKQLALVREGNGFDMAFCYVQNFHSPELDAGAIAKAQAPMDPAPGYIPSAFFVNREAFLRVGLFSSQWKIGEFIDWYARAKEKGLRSCMVEDLLLMRRLHSTNQGIRERASQKDYLSVLRESIKRRKENP